MTILFLSLIKFVSFDERNIYTDLLRQFMKDGHNVYAVCPSERRNGEKTNLKRFDSSAILTVKTFNIQKANILEKGIGTLTIKGKFIRAIKKHFKGIKFDLILYPTPPITLFGVVKFFKKRDNAKTYLMLKDIFPQNAVDLGLIKTSGIKGLIYKYFRKLEKKLYAVSDRIGCMTDANAKYVLEHNPEIEREKVEIFPNCIEIQTTHFSSEQKNLIRSKYGLPLDKKVFIYGGNLGKPQNIPFIVECLKTEMNNNDVFFLIVGDGTEYKKIEQYYKTSNQSNLKLLKSVPRDEFNSLVFCSDVGLIFLDYRFTIPNFPSRILSYMEADLPVLALTDESTDLNEIITIGKFGWWLPSNDSKNFSLLVNKALFKNPTGSSRAFLKDNYSVSKNVRCILNSFQNLD